MSTIPSTVVIGGYAPNYLIGIGYYSPATLTSNVIISHGSEPAIYGDTGLTGDAVNFTLTNEAIVIGGHGIGDPRGNTLVTFKPGGAGVLFKEGATLNNTPGASIQGGAGSTSGGYGGVGISITNTGSVATYIKNSSSISGGIGYGDNQYVYDRGGNGVELTFGGFVRQTGSGASLEGGNGVDGASGGRGVSEVDGGGARVYNYGGAVLSGGNVVTPGVSQGQGGVGVSFQGGGGSLVNSASTVSGGYSKSSNGGDGVRAYTYTGVTNQDGGTIAGGDGAASAHGGIGVDLSTASVLDNTASSFIRGGNGGTGGAGVYLQGTGPAPDPLLRNYGKIYAGSSLSPGKGAVGVETISNSKGINYAGGKIYGGLSEQANGGEGVYINGGSFSNFGAITGGKFGTTTHGTGAGYHDSVDFGPTGGVLTTDSSAQFFGAIGHFGSSETIDIAGVYYKNVTFNAGTSQTAPSITLNNGPGGVMSFAGDHGYTFSFTPDGSGGTLVHTNAPDYVAGTLNKDNYQTVVVGNPDPLFSNSPTYGFRPGMTVAAGVHIGPTTTATYAAPGIVGQSGLSNGTAYATLTNHGIITGADASPEVGVIPDKDAKPVYSLGGHGVLLQQTGASIVNDAGAVIQGGKGSIAGGIGGYGIDFQPTSKGVGSTLDSVSNSGTIKGGDAYSGYVSGGTAGIGVRWDGSGNYIRQATASASIIGGNGQSGGNGGIGVYARLVNVYNGDGAQISGGASYGIAPDFVPGADFFGGGFGGAGLKVFGATSGTNYSVVNSAASISGGKAQYNNGGDGLDAQAPMGALTITNENGATIQGGDGTTTGYGDGFGGTGLSATGHVTVTNDAASSILGGKALLGGVGVNLSASTLHNSGTIRAGATTQPKYQTPGATGLHAEAGSTAKNYGGGKIFGGDSPSGSGGFGVYLDGSSLTNAGKVYGGFNLSTATRSDAVYFGPHASTMNTVSSADFYGDIGHFVAGDSIDITDITPNNIQFNSGSGTADPTITLNADKGGTLDFSGDAGSSFSIVSDGHNGTLVTIDAPPCYVRGTRIRTHRGDVRVEALRVGDYVVTVSGALRPIRWLGHRAIDCSRYAHPETVWPIYIGAGSFAENLPSSDLYVSPGHSIVVNGVLVQAESLVNDVTIRQVRRSRVEYWHVELESHDILLAEGLPAESYLDTGNREAFVNGGQFIDARPDFAAKHWTNTCLPLVLDGPLLGESKAALLSRAEALGYRLDSNVRVHLELDGKRIDPTNVSLSQVTFEIPPSRGAALLRCRTFVPARVEARSFDRRELGLCVSRLLIDGNDVPLTSPLFRENEWHDLEYAAEQPRRWSRETVSFPPGAGRIVLDLCEQSRHWERPVAALATAAG